METWQHQHLNHFDLQRQPFQKLKAISIAWRSEKQQAAFSELKRGLLEQKDSVLLTGPSGSGKSVLAAQLAADIPCRIIHAKIPHAGMDSVQFYQLLAETFQVKDPFVSKGGFLVQVRQNLTPDPGPDSQVVIIVDDAHRMGSDLLDGMRMLAGIKVQNRRLINFFFVGRRRFSETLAGQADQTLYKSIAVHAQLEYLSNKDTADYMRECLRQAGARGSVFDISAEAEVFRISRGNLRLINPICELSLLVAFADGRRQVSNRIVGESAGLLGLPARQIDSAVFLETAEYVIHEKRRELGIGAENSENDEGALAATQPPDAAEPTVIKPKRSSDSRTGGTALTSFSHDAAADFELCCKKSRQSSFLTHIGISLIVVLFFGFGVLHIKGKQADMQVAQPLSTDVLQADQKTGAHVLLTANDRKGGGNPAADAAAETESEGTAQEDKLSDVKTAAMKFENNHGRLAVKQEVIRFNNDPNEILPENEEILFQIADHLMNDPASNITLRGYCDVVGARENNLNLSLFQSNIVKSYLVAKGVSPGRIRALAFGRELPVTPGHYKEMGYPKRMVIIEWPDSGRSHDEIVKKSDTGVQAPIKRYPLP
jgi:type II secretory pathway predicted ATPase ExeA/outer membrane protein OmpA-like peptidoglycan-associated protein